MPIPNSPYLQPDHAAIALRVVRDVEGKLSWVMETKILPDEKEEIIARLNQLNLLLEEKLNAKKS